MDARELTRAERVSIRRLVKKWCANFDPELERALSDTGHKAELRACAVCGRLFPRQGKRAFCSGTCKEVAKRKRQREYMRRQRAACGHLSPEKPL